MLEHLDFDIGPVNKIITVTIEGVVEVEDLQRLVNASAQPPMGAQAGDLAKVREKHHTVARLLASGMPQRLISATCGYTEGYLSTLLNNPSMQELVAYYRASAVNASERVAERLKSVAMDAVDKLAEQLEADELDANELLAVAKLGLDRSGHGPQSKHHHVDEHHILDHAELERLNREARKQSEADVIHLPALPAPATDEA